MDDVGNVGTLEHPELALLGDRFLQALETLLLTARDAFQDCTPEHIDTLERITQDRREVMTRIRDTCFEAQKDLAPNVRAFLFELTNTFARAVYLLHSLATLLNRRR